MKLDFAFYVGGLEAGIMNLLKSGDAALQQAGMTGVKEFAKYSGDLDREDLVVALKSLAPRFPLVLISYGSGKDRRKAATGVIEKEPIEVEHHCGFVVIVASNDLRGSANRITSANAMVGEVRQLLGGVQFEIEIDGEAELLNHSPFIPVAVETIARLPDLTAYAVHFDTMFHEWLPDRRVVFSGNVEEILLDIEANNLPAANGSNNLPGIYMEKKNES
jgi:hypothetical protein